MPSKSKSRTARKSAPAPPAATPALPSAAPSTPVVPAAQTVPAAQGPPPTTVTYLTKPPFWKLLPTPSVGGQCNGEVTREFLSEFWDEKTKKFRYAPPNPKGRRVDALQRGKDYADYFADIGDTLVAAWNKHRTPKASDQREWRYLQDGNLVLYDAGNDIDLCEVRTHGKPNMANFVQECAEDASALLRDDPNRSRGVIMLLRRSRLQIVIADVQGAVCADVVDFEKRYEMEQVAPIVSALLAIHISPISVFGFDSTITLGIRGQKDWIYAADKQRCVEEVLEDYTDRGLRKTVVRQVSDSDEDTSNVRHVKDDWVSRGELSQEEDIRKLLEGIVTVIPMHTALVPYCGSTYQKDETAIIRPDEHAGKGLVHRRQTYCPTKPLKRFDDLFELLSAFRDYVKTYFHIHKKHGIIHMNITSACVGISMTQHKMLKGRRVRSGVFLDFGHARVFGERCYPVEFDPDHAFASIEILVAMSRKQAYKVNFSDGVQALFNVFLAACLPDDAPALAYWRHSVDTALWHRTRIMTDEDEFRQEILDKLSPSFAPVIPHLVELRAVFLQESIEREQITDILNAALDALVAEPALVANESDAPPRSALKDLSTEEGTSANHGRPDGDSEKQAAEKRQIIDHKTKEVPNGEKDDRNGDEKKDQVEDLNGDEQLTIPGADENSASAVVVSKPSNKRKRDAEDKSKRQDTAADAVEHIDKAQRPVKSRKTARNNAMVEPPRVSTRRSARNAAHT
ncbi:hypothetical protein HDZ31DRAFT_66897 [Schizophyllum fasciatum]